MDEKINAVAVQGDLRHALTVLEVRTRNGERLEIHSPKLGYTIYLDALELEAISWQPVETFSRMLENPWGPS